MSVGVGVGVVVGSGVSVGVGVSARDTGSGGGGVDVGDAGMTETVVRVEGVPVGVAIEVTGVCVGLLVGVIVGVLVLQATSKSLAFGTNNAHKVIHAPEATRSRTITLAMANNFSQLTRRWAFSLASRSSTRRSCSFSCSSLLSRCRGGSGP